MSQDPRVPHGPTTLPDGTAWIIHRSWDHAVGTPTYHIHEDTIVCGGSPWGPCTPPRFVKNGEEYGVFTIPTYKEK